MQVSKHENGLVSIDASFMIAMHVTCASSGAPRQVRLVTCALPCAPRQVRFVTCAMSRAFRHVRHVRCASSCAPRHVRDSRRKPSSQADFPSLDRFLANRDSRREPLLLLLLEPLFNNEWADRVL